MADPRLSTGVGFLMAVNHAGPSLCAESVQLAHPVRPCGEPAEHWRQNFPPLYFGAVEVECLLGFSGQVHQVRHAALHAKRHFVLRDSGGGFRVGKSLAGKLIQLVQRIQHRAPAVGIHTLRIFDVEHWIADTAEGDAGESRGQKTAAPHAGKQGLGGLFGGPTRVSTTKAGRLLLSLPSP